LSSDVIVDTIGMANVADKSNGGVAIAAKLAHFHLRGLLMCYADLTNNCFIVLYWFLRRYSNVESIVNLILKVIKVLFLLEVISL
jgi:hypothetical protein